MQLRRRYRRQVLVIKKLQDELTELRAEVLDLRERLRKEKQYRSDIKKRAAVIRASYEALLRVVRRPRC